MRRIATLLVLASVFSFHRAPAGLSEQLVLAEKAGDIHAQIEILRRILDKEPLNSRLQEQVIRLWMQVEDHDMAEAALRGWKGAPERLRAEIGAEILFARDDRPDDAIALLEAYHSKNPTDLTATRQLARYLETTGRYRKLVTLLDAAPGVTDEADLLLVRARARRAEGDFEGALRDFGLAEKRDASVAQAERPVYERLQSLLPRLQSVGARLKENPEDVPALLTRAVLLSSLNAPAPLVAADVEKAWRAAPESMAARILYARFTLSADRAKKDLSVDVKAPLPPPETIESLLRLDGALAARPGDPTLLAARSFELNDKPRQHALALRDAEAALAADPANANALVEKIYALVKLGRTPEAAATLGILEKSHPKPARLAHACQYLAEGEMAELRFDAALEFANRGLKAAPTPGLYKTRATILNRLGRLAESQADLASAKKLEKK